MSPKSRNVQRKAPAARALRDAGLFAGVGGIELGLQRAGHHAELLCEIDPAAQAVLAARFPQVPLVADVREIKSLPAGLDMLAGGFPCQDLSQAGATRGIGGPRSGLVDQVFRLLRTHDVPRVMLENVPFMLQLRRGTAMAHIVAAFEELGYAWAYRVVDSRAFGLPQRRQRVIMIASRVDDPAAALHGLDAGVPEDPPRDGRACGFYWTEGLRGLGWAVDAVPTLKTGSGLGIPSPPALWMPDNSIVTPDIRDAERLQGFDVDWTTPAESVKRKSYRWTLVGNAVSVNVAQWVGARLAASINSPATSGEPERRPLVEGRGWPQAACGAAGRRWEVEVSAFPIVAPRPPLAEFLQFPTKPLSAKATAGFLSRLEKGNLRFPREFAEALRAHLGSMTKRAPRFDMATG